MKLNNLYDDRVYRFVGVVGDLHNNFNIVTNFLRGFENYKIALICVGDFTIGLGKQSDKDNQHDILKLLNDRLVLKDSMLYTIRGNHDNPEYFDGKHDFSNIKFLPDYTVLTIDGKRVFCLGGAISIDRKNNIEGIDWFPNEVVNFDYEIIDELLNIDIMISHMAPEDAYPFGFNHLVERYALTDKTLKQELILERANMKNFVLKLSENNPYYRSHFYGHYHENKMIYINDIKFQMLNIGQIEELR